MASHYLVKEIFGPTLQGEGAHAGKACVFLRFAACNLTCTWCDTDFAAEGARKLTADEIVSALLAIDAPQPTRLVIVTGGEPSLQWDAPLANALRAAGFAVHMESNGTQRLAAPVDWLTISPKPQFHPPRLHLVAENVANEVKVVVDGTVTTTTLDQYAAQYPGATYFVQPCMDANHAAHVAAAVALVLARPTWRLSLQLHKIIGVP